MAVIKLLIVDDETLTRNGLKNSIDWISLGIDEVYLAGDGLDGLRSASAHHPDIILSDVRMPRMTGIEMMTRVKETSPDTVFIFMSGYSDKEYLKAAIRLQAVSYVEKPLDIDEVSGTVREAVERCLAIRRNRNAENLSDNVQAGHLAIRLTLPYHSTKESVQDLSQAYCRKYGSADLFHAAFTILLKCDGRSEPAPDFIEGITADFHDRIRPIHMHVISAEKKTDLFVFQVFRKESFSSPTIQAVLENLKGLIPSDHDFFIAAGPVVSGIQKLYDSYSGAVVLLQQCFFRDPGTVLDAGDQPSMQDSALFADSGSVSALAGSLRDAIRSSDRTAAGQICEKLYDEIYGSTSLLERSIQTLYYQIILFIDQQRKRRQLPGAGTSDAAEEALDRIAGCFSFPELHRLLTDTVSRYFSDLENYVPENSSVYLIKNYISKHYADPALSTKEISEYARLSASYACTVFKNETGQTLNQFLTEFRLERAKELLSDPRNNISDVASLVGYNDSNYFGKAFKKYAGVSPSDYRESRDGQ